MESFQKFSMKDAIYAVAGAWNTDMVVHAWHILPTTRLSIDLEGFCISREKKWYLVFLHSKKIPHVE